MNLQTRVVNILTHPRQEWTVIASEATDAARLYREYIIILALIPAVCTFLGLTLIGTYAGAGFLRPAFGIGLVGSVVSFVLTLVGVYLAAWVIEKLAPTFVSHGDLVQALKLVAYSMTPVWIGGVLSLVPLLAALHILTFIYALYLFYLGLPIVMRTPQDRVIPYMIASAVVIIIINVIVGWIATVIMFGSLFARL